MEILPAIDLRGGKCVRLVQGKPEESTEYYEEPVQAALHWQQPGAAAR